LSLHPPPLHSFPTRRSSDLATTPEGFSICISTVPVTPDTEQLTQSGCWRKVTQLCCTPAEVGVGSRLPASSVVAPAVKLTEEEKDRKSTRLNSSHLGISYAV